MNMSCHFCNCFKMQHCVTPNRSIMITSHEKQCPLLCNTLPRFVFAVPSTSRIPSIVPLDFLAEIQPASLLFSQPSLLFFSSTGSGLSCPCSVLRLDAELRIGRRMDMRHDRISHPELEKPAPLQKKKWPDVKRVFSRREPATREAGRRYPQKSSAPGRTTDMLSVHDQSFLLTFGLQLPDGL